MKSFSKMIENKSLSTGSVKSKDSQVKFKIIFLIDLMMILTQINRRKRYVNIPRSKKRRQSVSLSPGETTSYSGRNDRNQFDDSLVLRSHDMTTLYASLSEDLMFLFRNLGNVNCRELNDEAIIKLVSFELYSKVFFLKLNFHHCRIIAIETCQFFFLLSCFIIFFFLSVCGYINFPSGFLLRKSVPFLHKLTDKKTGRKPLTVHNWKAETIFPFMHFNLTNQECNLSFPCVCFPNVFDRAPFSFSNLHNLN